MIGHAEMEKEIQKTVASIIQSQESIETEREIGSEYLNSWVVAWVYFFTKVMLVLLFPTWVNFFIIGHSLVLLHA